LSRHLDCLAEICDRLLEGRAAQRLVARPAPAFDREIVEAGLGKVMLTSGAAVARSWSSRRISPARPCSACLRLLSRLS
jgi:hypothetical protein